MRTDSIPTGLARIALAVLLVSLAPVAGYAQDTARANVSVSYALLTDYLSEEVLPVGWVVSGSYRTGRVAIVAEAGGSYSTGDTGASVRTHAFLAGVRASRHQPTAPFAQVLAGVACYCGSSTTLGVGSNRFTIQPGAGVDFTLNQHWAVRLQGDYRFVAGADGADGSNQFRVSGGLVLRFWE